MTGQCLRTGAIGLCRIGEAGNPGHGCGFDAAGAWDPFVDVGTKDEAGFPEPFDGDSGDGEQPLNERRSGVPRLVHIGINDGVGAARAGILAALAHSHTTGNMIDNELITTIAVS